MNPNRATSASTSSHPGGYLIGDLVIEPRLRRIRTPADEVELTQRVFDLLLVFIDEPFTLHGRERLFERVWGTLHIEDTNLTQNISVLRRALGGERKHWIRTVSGVGYCFEPPCEVRRFDSVQALQAALDGDATPTPHGPADATATAGIEAQAISAVDPHAKPLPSSGGRPAFATAVLLMLAIAGSLGTTGATRHAGRIAVESVPARHVSMSIVIAEADELSSPSQQQATRLLREWVRWKLALLPSIQLVEEDELIASRSTPSYLLGIGLQATPDGSGDVFLDVAFKPVYRANADARGLPGDTARRIRIPAGDGGMTATLDAASDAVLARVLPHRRDDRWPKLALDADTAGRFAEAARASHAGQAQARSLLEQVVAAAPEFGPARQLLAREMVLRKEFRQAAEQARLAHVLTTPLPADAAVMLAADTGGLGRTSPAEAAALHARLSAANPSRPDIVLAQALILQRDTQPEAAFRLLSRPEWAREGGRLRIRQLIARAETAFVLGDLEQSEHSANQALERLQHPPMDLPAELAAARMVHALMWTQRYQSEEQVGLFAQAADAYEAAGHRYGADIARFHQAVFGDDLEAARLRLPPLLATARGHGDHAGVAMLHRTMAWLYLERDDRARAVKVLEDGLESMRLAGDLPNAQLLDMELLGEDLRAGRFAQAAKRVERLRDNRLWTHYRYRAARYESDLLAITGHYRDALASLDRTLGDSQRATRWDMSSTEAADIACWRMEALARIGELAAARAQARGCRSLQPARASIVEAWLARLSGDPATAAATLRIAEAQIAQEPNELLRIYLTIDMAALKIRLGEPLAAVSLLQRMRETAATLDDDLLLADIDTGLAEAAAARGDWQTVARYRTQLRRRIPAEVHSAHRRIDILEIAALDAGGQRAEAQRKASAIRAEARRSGDLVLLSEVDAVLPPETTAARR
ncbi:MAG: winged helix-turn-helix domain-containing protein [Lysobacter sp.]|nr:winged helix-turn-helix domain-containing protein [Lysobacter sp.]